MVIAQKGKSPCLRFGRKQDLKGERGKPIYWCMPIELNSIFSLVSFIFFSVFLSYLFSFLLTLFFFSLRKNTLFFDPRFMARQGPFYNACHDQGFTILPLNRICLVWAYLPTTKGVCHSLLPDRGRFHFSLYCSTSFLPRCKCSLSPLSRHALNGSPSNLPLLGGRHPNRMYLPKGLGQEP